MEELNRQKSDKATVEDRWGRESRAVDPDQLAEDLERINNMPSPGKHSRLAKGDELLGPKGDKSPNIANQGPFVTKDNVPNYQPFQSHAGSLEM